MGTSGTLKNALQMYEENGVTVMASDKDLKRFKLCFSLYNPQKTLMKVLVSQLYPALCEPHELQLNRFLCPWNFPGKNTGVEFSSVIYWCPTLCNPMNCSTPGLPVYQQLPCPGYDKQCCDEHWGTRVSFRSGFLGVYVQKWDCWVIWQFYFQFF